MEGNKQVPGRLHKLRRQVRFSVNPFLAEDCIGFNSFVSKPAGEGLAIFLELEIGLEGAINSETGFIVNVSDIDYIVRKYTVPVFSTKIRKSFSSLKHLSLGEIEKTLKEIWVILSDKFNSAKVFEICLKLNPFRKITMDSSNNNVIYFSEKFEFAAMHKLWNDQLSDERNFQVFGKCGNPAGHGHNYIVEVTICKTVDDKDFSICNFEQIVETELIRLLDHKNLNADLEYFQQINPTMENIAVYGWEMLKDKFPAGKLQCITIWESQRTQCSYYG
jgi:6-pyruvoyltetrahydropterin/6-carboxytetrahydropterin synthase